MNTSPQLRTKMFARVLGPFFAIASVIAAIRADDLAVVVSEFTGDAVWPWVMGAFALMGGLAIVAFHQIWRGAAAIIVSVLGWLLIARGILLLAFPDAVASLADRVIGAVWIWQAVYVAFGLVGVYLAYIGWWPQRAVGHRGGVAVRVTHVDAV